MYSGLAQVETPLEKFRDGLCVLGSGEGGDVLLVEFLDDLRENT